MRRLKRKITGLFRGQRGFSLIETVVAVAILGFIGAGVVLAIDTNSRASRVLDEQVVGMNLATDCLEAIRELEYDNTDPEYSSAGDSINPPPPYIVTIEAHYSDNGTTWVDTCTGEKLQRITVTVSKEGGAPVLSICTFRTEF